MSYTLKVRNGQISLNASTGQLDTVEGSRKASQDMAESLLQEFLPEQQYGSYLKAIVQNKIPFATELLVRYYVSDAISRLMVKQDSNPETTSDEKIRQIDELITSPNTDGTVGFLVKASTEEGSTAETALVEPTMLQHLMEGF